MPPCILIVGGAATGRVPMTAALLGRLLEQRGLNWQIVAAGVVAHDDDPAEVEARDTMITMGLNIMAYRANPLTDALVDAATLVLAVDSGSARVIHARYPAATARTTTLGELAGRARDIPDPFRMQIGAWITYAREIEQLLKAGLDRLIERAGEPPSPAPTAQAAANDGLPAPRGAALARCERLLALMTDLPAMVPWPDARRQLEGEIGAASAHLFPGNDLAVAYAALLRALLSLSDAPPTPGQLRFLAQAVERLRAPVNQQAITTLSAQMGTWASL